MEYFLWSLITIVFAYSNYQLIVSDIQEKKIPNKALLFLLALCPFWYTYAWYYGYFIDTSFLVLTLQTFLTLTVSFLMYYYNIWGAGDAKYLLVLSLFIPYIWIIVFIGNIALVVLVYMLLYFLWFWLWKNLWVKESRNSLYRSLYEVQKDKFLSKHGRKNRRDFLWSLLWWLNIFLVIFMSFRIMRTHVIDYMRENHGERIIEIFSGIWWIYIILLILWIMVGIFLAVRRIFQYIQKKSWSYNSPFLLICINLLWISILVYEYIQYPSEIGKKLLLIFTLYLGIYSAFRILLFAYKLTFISNEESIIHIDDVTPGWIIDEWFLKRIFKNNEYLKKNNIDLHSLDFQDVVFLKKFLHNFNSYHKEKKTQNFTKVESVKVIKATAFSGFICSGFIVSFFLQGAIFEYIIYYLYNFFLIQ